MKITVLLLLLLLPSLAGATNIHVTWGYTPPTEPAVSGFRLYQEGQPVCMVASAQEQEMDCEVTLIKKVTTYTLAAMFVDGTESPHSAPYAFDMDGKLLAPWGFVGK